MISFLYQVLTTNIFSLTDRTVKLSNAGEVAAPFSDHKIRSLSMRGNSWALDTYWGEQYVWLQKDSNFTVSDLTGKSIQMQWFIRRHLFIFCCLPCEYSIFISIHFLDFLTHLAHSCNWTKTHLHRQRWMTSLCLVYTGYRMRIIVTALQLLHQDRSMRVGQT